MIQRGDVLLSSTLHDPKGVFLNKLNHAGIEIWRAYAGWVVNVTSNTHPQVKEILNNMGPLNIIMVESDGVQLSADKVENDHLSVLQASVHLAEKSSIRKLQYTDGDRIITAAIHYPDKLRAMARQSSSLIGDNGSYVNFRRSLADYFSHHPPLVQTEFEFNRLYTLAFGLPLDIGSTAHGMSLDVVNGILTHSGEMEPVTFPHPKWLLIAKKLGVPILSAESEKVLTFETPDQFISEVEAQSIPPEYRWPSTQNDDYIDFQRRYMSTLGLASTNSVREWDLRFNTLKAYTLLLDTSRDILGLNTDDENDLHSEIQKSLHSMEGRRKVIVEALIHPSPEKRR